MQLWMKYYDFRQIKARNESMGKRDRSQWYVECKCDINVRQMQLTLKVQSKFGLTIVYNNEGTEGDHRQRVR